jgi:hypothetical protein
MPQITQEDTIARLEKDRALDRLSIIDYTSKAQIILDAFDTIKRSYWSRLSLALLDFASGGEIKKALEKLALD